MAYIKTEQVKEIRTQLKKEFPNLKFSVTRHHYSKVSIIIKSGDMDFFSNYNVKRNDIVGDYIIVSPYHYEKDFTDQEILNTLKKIIEIAHGQGWYDNSDSMTDYFDTAYYVDIKIGEWDNPYVVKQQRAA